MSRSVLESKGSTFNLKLNLIHSCSHVIQDVMIMGYLLKIFLKEEMILLIIRYCVSLTPACGVKLSLSLKVEIRGVDTFTTYDVKHEHIGVKAYVA